MNPTVMPALPPFVERVESFCKERPFATMALSFGIGVSVGVSSFSAIVPLAALRGFKNLAAQSNGSLAGKLTLASLATDFLMEASSLFRQRVLARDAAAEEVLP